TNLFRDGGAWTELINVQRFCGLASVARAEARVGSLTGRHSARLTATGIIVRDCVRLDTAARFAMRHGLLVVAGGELFNFCNRSSVQPFVELHHRMRHGDGYRFHIWAFELRPAHPEK